MEAYPDIDDDPTAPDPGITIADFVSGNIENESDLDETWDVRPLDDGDLAALEGACLCVVVYDSDISINIEYEGAVPVGNLQGATLGLTAFNVTATSGPGGLPESESSSSLKDVTIELADPLSVTDICSEVADN